MIKIKRKKGKREKISCLAKNQTWAHMRMCMTHFAGWRESVESTPTPHVLQLQWVWRGSAMKKMQDSDAPLYPEEEGYGGLGIKRVNMHCHVMFS